MVNCGRRWGKSILGVDLAIDSALDGWPVGWFAPQYRLLREAWRELEEILAGVARFNKAERRIDLPNGGFIECWAFDRNPNAGRSRRYKRVIVDEAAHCDNLEVSWTRAIRPTLTDFKGDAWFLSSPNGENYFHKLYLRGQDLARPAWQSWTQTSYDNLFLDPKEIDSARDDLPDWVFDQEYLAKFVAGNAGELLPGWWVDRMAQVERSSDRAAGRRRMGVDLGYGTGRDLFTCLIRDDLGLLWGGGSAFVGVAEAAAIVADKSREWGVRQEDIVYDAGGPGRDMERHLEPYRITEAVPYYGSGRGGVHHFNRRSRCAWRVRQRLDPTRPLPMAADPDPRLYHPLFPPSPATAELQPPFALPDDRPWWGDLAEELKELRYVMRDRKVALEKKEAMAARLKRSPNWCDALFMTFDDVDED